MLCMDSSVVTVDDENVDVGAIFCLIYGILAQGRSPPSDYHRVLKHRCVGRLLSLLACPWPSCFYLILSRIDAMCDTEKTRRRIAAEKSSTLKPESRRSKSRSKPFKKMQQRGWQRLKSGASR